MKISLTHSRMCLYYRFTPSCKLWLNCINVSLSTMLHYFPYANQHFPWGTKKNKRYEVPTVIRIFIISNMIKTAQCDTSLTLQANIPLISSSIRIGVYFTNQFHNLGNRKGTAQLFQLVYISTMHESCDNPHKLALGFKELNCDWLIMSYDTEIVWWFGFSNNTFRVERSDDRQYVCVCRLLQSLTSRPVPKVAIVRTLLSCTSGMQLQYILSCEITRNSIQLTVQSNCCFYFLKWQATVVVSVPSFYLFQKSLK